jgi:hypothetical protein
MIAQPQRVAAPMTAIRANPNRTPSLLVLARSLLSTALPFSAGIRTKGMAGLEANPQGDTWCGKALLHSMSEFNVLSLDSFIIFIVSVGELVRLSTINAKFRGTMGGIIFLKNNTPLRPENFALMNDG